MPPKISTKDISELRARTGAGIGDCKAALEEAAGDMEKAAENLRKRGIAKAEKRAGRSASQGLVVIAAATDASRAAMIELNCETDFVARTEEFGTLARDLADHVLAHGTDGVNGGSLDAAPFRGKSVGEVVKEVSGKTGEAMALARHARFSEDNGVVGAYLHFNGQVGALVAISGGRGDAVTALARDLALHVTSTDPLGVDESDLPGDVLARERRIAEEQVAAEGKPEQIRAKIVDGKMRKFVAERTLLGQPFIKDESKTVADLMKAAAAAAGAPLTVTGLARFKVGEA